MLEKSLWHYRNETINCVNLTISFWWWALVLEGLAINLIFYCIHRQWKTLASFYSVYAIVYHKVHMPWIFFLLQYCFFPVETVLVANLLLPKSYEEQLKLYKHILICYVIVLLNQTKHDRIKLLSRQLKKNKYSWVFQTVFGVNSITDARWQVNKVAAQHGKHQCHLMSQTCLPSNFFFNMPWEILNFLIMKDISMKVNSLKSTKNRAQAKEYHESCMPFGTCKVGISVFMPHILRF